VLNIFHKGDISTKLNAFLVLPIFTLLFFAFIAIFDKYKKLEETQDVLHYSLVVKDLSVLIHSLQTERGLSAGAFSAKNNDYQLQLAKQRKITTDTYSKITHVFTTPPSYLSQKRY